MSNGRYTCRCSICGTKSGPSPDPCHKHKHTCRWRDPTLGPIISPWPCPYNGFGDILTMAIRIVTFGLLKPCIACKRRRAWLNERFPLRGFAKRFFCPQPKVDLEHPRLLFTLPGHGELAGDMQYLFANVKGVHPNWRIDVTCCPKIGRTLTNVTERQFRSDGKGPQPNPRNYQMVRRLPWCKCPDPPGKCLRDFFGSEPQ